MQAIDSVLGRRLRHHAADIGVPSPTRGFGSADNRGLGAPSNGESFHGGTKPWERTITRLSLRQTFGLSCDAFGTDDDPRRFAGPLAVARMTSTAGKLAARDVFDTTSNPGDNAGRVPLAIGTPRLRAAFRIVANRVTWPCPMTIA
ncbi:hypothetical protein [Paracraurococcus ruber]|uniref:Uncharacterized protein n=1 Tax=Paracraurococcus ruber TaxID=77675 RepID=A0ABS1D1D5_9PROT|nr:hypothetical protein [Paracraurococcus ruber]MBK1660333.1 hypothetical protein [Paracraurococcus ruber]TDG31358.1 hypothetical protein E2C05_11360 [Paracraurococcus ruber]